jgi:hypothetical protein
MKKNKTLHDYFSRIGKKAAKARMKKITPAERQRIAREAALTRWSRKGGKSS